MTGARRPGSYALVLSSALRQRSPALNERCCDGQARQREALPPCVREPRPFESSQAFQHTEDTRLAVAPKLKNVNSFIELTPPEQSQEEPTSERGWLHPFSVSQGPECLSSFTPLFYAGTAR